VLVEKPIRRIEKPIKQILIDSRDFWDREGTRLCVRENFRRMIECGTSALGWLTYASDAEIRRVCCFSPFRSSP
jgi:hypothetical protein